MSAKQNLIILMGVSGCGKSTIGQRLSFETGIPFYDGDDFHSDENVKKMADGQPLTDEDRKPWLESLAEKLAIWNGEAGAILACSALKENYRSILKSKVAHIHWVHLKGDFDLIQSRLKQRNNHYMPEALLHSQFDTLETPSYAQPVDISLSPAEIVNEILSGLALSVPADIGLIGLGVMGQSLALNMADQGHQVAVYNRVAPGEETVVSDFMTTNESYPNLSGYTELESFIQGLALPRKVFLMVPAGQPVEQMVEVLSSMLDPYDIIIDGGNSFHEDTTANCITLEAIQNLHFLGLGVSGGEKGARNGPSLMPGGSKEAYEEVAYILESIAAKDKDGKPCCSYIGAEGAGHYVKMVHNGIEYVEMQLLAEVYDLCRDTMSNNEIADLFERWNAGKHASYLLEVTIEVLRKREGEGYLLDLILDRAGNKGTGSWSSQSAMSLGMPNSLMAASVFARYTSSFKSQRMDLSRIEAIVSHDHPLDFDLLERAYHVTRILNHQQGFNLLEAAAKYHGWELDLPEIARVWTNGCIIRSEMMEECRTWLKVDGDLFATKKICDELFASESALKEIMKAALDLRKPLPVFSAAWDYWLSMTTQNSPANLIQGQRDFFGAHTFQRIDRDESEKFHADWG